MRFLRHAGVRGILPFFVAMVVVWSSLGAIESAEAEPLDMLQVSSGPPLFCQVDKRLDPTLALGDHDRQTKSAFWTRDYFPTSAARGHAALDGNGAVRMRLGLDGIYNLKAYLSVYAKSLHGAPTPCSPIIRATFQASAWSLVSTLREALASGTAVDLNADLLLLKFAREQACDANKRHCDLAALVLAAQESLLIDEAQNHGVALPTGSLPRVATRDLLFKALIEAAQEGPSIDAAEGWMVLAEFDAPPGSSNPAPQDVERAYRVLRDSLQYSTRNESTGISGPLSHEFQDRFLPIFQEAADETWARLGGDRANLDRKSKDELNAALLEIGETSRRSQIVSVIADACDPLQVPFSTEDLRPGELIYYPIVGTRRTYLLVGRPVNFSRKEHSRAPGWTLVVSDVGAGAGELANIADRFVDELQKEADPEHQSEVWDAYDAQLLYRRLFEKLELPETLKSYDAGTAAPTMLVFPDPILRNVPWALLHAEPAIGGATTVDNDDVSPRLLDPKAHYLVKSFAFAIEPGLAYIQPASNPRRRGSMLAGGYTDEVAQMNLFVTRLSLENSPRYIKDHLFKPVIVGKDFSEPNLLESIERVNPPVLLLATHAIFQPGRSGIQTANSSELMPFDEIEQSVRQEKLKAKQIALLILVACQGARGDAGDLGIAGAALRGGASATLGAVVEVDAAYATGYIAPNEDPNSPPPQSVRDKLPHITPFLQTYYSTSWNNKGSDTSSPAQSLRTTQMSALEGFNPDSNDTITRPQNWGVFVLVGNWR